MPDILAENPVIYDHWNPNIRDEVLNLADLPLLDSAGREKRIYNTVGAKITRRRAEPTPDGQARTWAGLLMKIREVDGLFERVDETPDRDPDADTESNDEAGVEAALTNEPQLNVYPQAFTGRFGHFQANRLMYHFDEPIKEINDEFKANNTNRNGNSILITPDSSQGYNELSHRTAPRAGGQDVQQGLITAAIMRGAGLSPAQQVKTDKWRNNCIGSLPHQRMRDKISLPECPRGFQMEHIYNIDLWAVEERQRHGG